MHRGSSALDSTEGQAEMPDATTKANEDHWNSSWRGRWPAAPHTMPTLRRSVLYSYDTSAPHPTPLHDRDDGWGPSPSRPCRRPFGP